MSAEYEVNCRCPGSEAAGPTDFSRNVVFKATGGTPKEWTVSVHFYNDAGQLDHVGFSSSFSAEEKKELERGYKWSRAVNDAIADMVHGVPPFPFVRESFEALAEKLVQPAWLWGLIGLNAAVALLRVGALADAWRLEHPRGMGWL